jgi:glycosyltransferase involved in cell wall biosynthesis
VSLSGDFESGFQQVPYGPKLVDTVRNLLFFRKQPADIYHITGHINYIALRFAPENTVLSMTDLRFLTAKSRLRRYFLKKLYLDMPVRRLKYITAISEQTKKEIIENTGCEPSKIRVLDNPLLYSFSSSPPRKLNEKRPVILQIGTMPNKNLPNLARALRGLSCTLRIIGDLSKEQLACLNENEVDFETVNELSDSEMIREYENADIVTYCSTYEGFGLPIIEAQAAGRAVISSDLSPMKETAGGGAELVDPYEVNSMRDGMLRLIKDEGHRENLIAKGLENIRRFEPAVVVKQYEALYREIVANNSK